MKVLLIGGTGVISTDVANHAIRQGMNVTVLNRGKTSSRLEDKIQYIHANVRDTEMLEKALQGKTFDTTVDFLSFTPQQLEPVFNVASNHCQQFIFVSSAATYDPTAKEEIFTEESPQFNPLWDYGYQKSKCESLLRKLCADKKIYYTNVRPAVTYGDTRIPYGIMPPEMKHWTLAHRILSDKPMFRWDAGKAIGHFTHTEDFAIGMVGLFGNPAAMNEDVHIASEDEHTWANVLDIIASELDKPAITVDIQSEKLVEYLPPSQKELLLGGRASSLRLDCSKIKKLVPEFSPKISLKEGIARTINYYRKNPEICQIDYNWDGWVDRAIFLHCKKHEPKRLEELNLKYCPSTLAPASGSRKIYLSGRNPKLYQMINFPKRVLRRLF